MPVYKALILNNEVGINYVEDQKEKLVESINTINDKLKTYDTNYGKISDSKLLSFLAIELQAELLELKEKKLKEINIEKKINNYKSENINLKDKLYKLYKQNEALNSEIEFINQESSKLHIQLETIINLLKENYE